jgi:fumarate reductase subunit D
MPIHTQATTPPTTPRNAAYRRDALWLAALIHRVSGILLACFLPLHFLALGLALEGEAKLGQFLKFGEQPVIKLAEGILVSLLAVHLLGGLRILAVEFGQRPLPQRRLVWLSFGAAAALGLLFLIRIL